MNDCDGDIHLQVTDYREHRQVRGQLHCACSVHLWVETAVPFIHGEAG